MSDCTGQARSRQAAGREQAGNQASKNPKNNKSNNKIIQNHVFGKVKFQRDFFQDFGLFSKTGRYRARHTLDPNGWFLNLPPGTDPNPLVKKSDSPKNQLFATSTTNFLVLATKRRKPSSPSCVCVCECECECEYVCVCVCDTSTKQVNMSTKRL